MSTYLAEEVVINILKRLNTKTLLRCRSVCKAWYILISTPHLISTHLDFNNTLSPHFLIGYCKDVGSRNNLSLHYDNENFDLHTQFQIPFESSHGYFYLVGSFNGLICLLEHYRSHPDNIILWNPLINKKIYLPDCIYMNNFSTDPSLAFGFDFVSNDYKVVRTVIVDCIYPKAEVYRLSTGIWKDISHLALPYNYPSVSMAIYVHGATHWLGWGELGKPMIVVFDLHNEVFREMMVPHSLADQYLWGDNLFNSQGLLCLIHSSKRRRFEIWMMIEYGVPESWKKISSVGIDSLCLPRGIRNNGEILWMTDERGLVSYNPRSKEMKELDIGGVGKSEPFLCLYAHPYVESLVLLDYPNSDIGVLGSHVECKEEKRVLSKRKRGEENDEIYVQEEEQG